MIFKQNIRAILAVLLIIFSPEINYSQIIVPDTVAYDTTANNDNSQKIKNTFFPIVFFLPETGFAFGVTGITTFRFSKESQETRPSQIIWSAAYTLKNQFLLFVPYEIYQNENKIRYKGELGFYKYFYNYYGIGGNSDLEDLENYDVIFPRINFSYARSDIANLFFGAGFNYDYFNITKLDSLGSLIKDQPIGVDGGQKINLIFNAFYDTRDNVFSASKGIYTEFIFEKSVIGSDFNYAKYIVDMRYFYPLQKDVVLASQLYGVHATESAPFFDLPYISTPSLSRGYSDRRFINYNLLNLQTELRFPIAGKFKGATFISSALAPDSLSSMGNNPILWSGGIGIRYEIDDEDKTRFRLDIAYGDALNFYLTANEAF